MTKNRIGLLAVSLVTTALSVLGAGVTPPDLTVADNAPMIRSWAPPVYPAALLKAKVAGKVEVRFIVDVQGKVRTARVLESTDPRLDDTAIATVKAWTFSPGLEEGKPAEACMDVTVECVPTKPRKSDPIMLPRADLAPHPAARTETEPKNTPAGDYPEILTERKIAGAVTFAGVVTAEGHVVSPRITGASQVEFILPALAALRHWEFTPATQGDLPSRSTTEGKITFDAIGDSRDDILAANGVTAPDGSVPPLAPGIFMAPDPVWPIEALLKGEGGSAVVEFSVRENGFTEHVRVREATKPEFGRALAAAMEAWIFEPAINGGRAVAVPLARRVEFKPVVAGKETVTDPVQRLVADLRSDKIDPAVKLDERLAPIYRIPPVYPAALEAAERPAGKAVIEFVIDREGRCRLPRIVSATREEFGWSAATAVAQWVFKAPLRGGQPVDVLIKVPFEFAAPER